MGVGVINEGILLKRYVLIPLGWRIFLRMRLPSYLNTKLQIEVSTLLCRGFQIAQRVHSLLHYRGIGKWR